MGSGVSGTKASGLLDDASHLSSRHACGIKGTRPAALFGLHKRTTQAHPARTSSHGASRASGWLRQRSSYVQYESTKRVQGAAGAGYCYWKERPAAILWLGMSILARVVHTQNWL